MVNSTTPAATTIAWCPQGIALHDGKDIALHPIEKDEESLLPQLPDNTTPPQCIYLPMEVLLLRSFTFPLKHPKLLDKDILLEELADTAGIKPDDWWLTWRASCVNDGIAGLVFGLHNTLKAELASHAPWQDAPLLLVDGWQRLNFYLTHETNDAAVVDMDADGVFLGVFRQGAWQGMRRLNADMCNAKPRQEAAQQVLWSLQSMGFDANTMPVLGCVTHDFISSLAPTESSQQAKMVDELHPRHLATLNLPLPSHNEALNLRHGSWASRQASANMQLWYRPAAIAATVLCLWLGITVVDNYQLEAQVADFDSRIVQAFHRGLPNQSVIIDALAQLRQAAEEKSNISQSNISQQLYIISQAFKTTPWQMQSLTFDQSGASMTGQVHSLDALNIIKEKLTQLSGREVRITDTNLKGNEVVFKVRW